MQPARGPPHGDLVVVEILWDSFVVLCSCKVQGLGEEETLRSGLACWS